jgi:hypothetical protein
MTYRIASRLQSLKRNFPSVAGLVIAITVLAVISSHPALATDTKGSTEAPSCGFSDAAFDPATDVNALEAYDNAIAKLLKEKKFAQLDCLADKTRAEKSRFSGGTWKLVEIYSGIEEPRPGHPTEEDWREHLALVEEWSSSNPKSITARIALAESYVDYGWAARGDGYSDSVSDSGWKLLAERMQKANNILQEASTLPTKCPEWYLAMLDVAQGQSWPLDQITAVFEQAARFEPAFQSYYRNYAHQLLPKWSGQEGDAARFAERAANKMGGEEGDILYFQIGAKIVCACQDPEGTYFSWPRLQKGFAALEKEYGSSLMNTNSFGMMAVKFQDWVAAEPAFQRIGDNWSPAVWITEQWFRSNQTIAARTADAQARSRAIQKEAESNVSAPEWESYRKGFDEKFAAMERSCLDQSKNEFQAQDDATSFDFYINIGKEGGADDGWGTHPTPMMQCLMKSLYDSHMRKEKPFPAPPKAPYWVVAHVDPSKIATAMK